MSSRLVLLGALLVSTFFSVTASAKGAAPAEAPANSPVSTSADFTPAHPYFGDLTGQAAPQPPASSHDQGHPGGEVFLGYSYARFNVKSLGNKENFDFHGGTASIAGNVNRWLGLVADFGGYKISGLPSGTDGKAFTFLFGPRFSHRGERWTPFLQFLFGAARLSTDFSGTPVPNSFFGAGSIHENAFATAMGGGLDLKLSKHLAWRVFQGEYLLTRFKDGDNNQQNNIRAATGLVFRFGGAPPPPPPNHPPVISITPNPDKVVAGSGDTVVVQARASDPDNDPLTYTWSATGGQIEGTGAEVRWNPGNAAPGSYTVTAKVDDARGGVADSSTAITVEPRPNRPPTVNCTASPQTVTPGQPVTITAIGADPDNDQLTYTFDAASGHVAASGATATFSTEGLAPGHYTVNCHANDGRGGLADGKADVEVQAPAPPPEQKQLEVRLSLHSIYFPTALPTVQNPNGGLLASQQRTLVNLAGDFKKYLAYKPDAHLILQGHTDPRGGAEYNKGLSERRVQRTKAFLVQHGVSADAIETQGLGEEQPMTPDQVKQAVEQDQNLTPAQKAQLTRNARVLALAQNRRVDVTLSTTGQTSVRQFPFNAEDALNLINPRRVAAGKPAPRKKRVAPKKRAPAK